MIEAELKRITQAMEANPLNFALNKKFAEILNTYKELLDAVQEAGLKDIE